MPPVEVVDQLLASAAIGRSLGERTVLVTPRQVMSYAAGIDARRPLYFSEQPVAPPAFVVCLEWPLLNGQCYRDLLRASQAVMERAIHLEQRSVFYGPIRSGMLVTTSGTLSDLRQSRRGTIAHVSLVHSSGGQVLATSDFIALFLRTHTDRSSVVRPRAQRVFAPDPGQWSGSVPLSPSIAHIYTECSGIWNPIHTEKAAAIAAGLEEPIMHGTWSWAVAMECAIDHACDGDPSRLTEWQARFMKPVILTRSVQIAGSTEGPALRANLSQDSVLRVVAQGRVTGRDQTTVQRKAKRDGD